MNAVRQALLLADVASCTCLTKTPDPQHHREDCPHRIYMEALVELERILADHDNLIERVNSEWIRLYGGGSVSHSLALLNRITALANDRDCWLGNAKTLQKDYNRLDAELRALRLAFAEASHNAGPAFVAHEDFAKVKDAYGRQLDNYLRLYRAVMGEGTRTAEFADPHEEAIRLRAENEKMRKAFDGLWKWYESGDTSDSALGFCLADAQEFLTRSELPPHTETPQNLSK